MTRGAAANQSFISGVVSGGQGMVDNWHGLGFVVRQGSQFLAPAHMYLGPEPSVDPPAMAGVRVRPRRQDTELPANVDTAQLQDVEGTR